MIKNRAKSVTAGTEDGAKKSRKIPDTAPLIAVLVLMMMYFSVASEYFFQVENFRNILANAAVTGIVCIPSTFLIIAGHIDLSVGSAAASCELPRGGSWNACSSRLWIGLWMF